MAMLRNDYLEEIQNIFQLFKKGESLIKLEIIF